MIGYQGKKPHIYFEDGVWNVRSGIYTKLVCRVRAYQFIRKLNEGSKMKETKLGKISKVKFGLGGYQDCYIGIFFCLEGSGWGVNDGKSSWDANKITCSDYCNWTEEDRKKQYDEIMRYISNILHKAKVDYIDDLTGIPVECTFEDRSLISWRILEEVL